MAKLTLATLTSAYQAVPALNANNILIEAALENTLSRDGTTPNTMSAVIDMNSNRILNVTQAVGGSDAVNLTQVNALISNASSATMTGPIAATLITVADVGGFYTAVDVESALQEVFTLLVSVTASQGASLVGIQDAAANFAATDVEAALAEIIADYAAVTASNGASKIGLEDSAALYSSTDVEAALAEVKTDLSATSGASGVGTLDSAGHFAASGVEDTLAEIGATVFPIQAVKTANTSRVNDPTPSNDPHLVGLTMPVGRYTIEGFLDWTQSGAGGGNGIQMRLRLTAGTVALPSGSLVHTTTAAPATPVAANIVTMDPGAAGQTVINDTVTGRRLSHYKGMVQVTSGPATFVIEWAQNTSNADAVTLRGNSWIKFTPIS